jgi:CHAT domain-containing protein
MAKKTTAKKAAKKAAKPAKKAAAKKVPFKNYVTKLKAGDKAPAFKGDDQDGKKISSAEYKEKKISRGSAAEIIQALFSDEYKIIHLAGHGVFNEDPTKGSGMVIGKNVFLSTREISQMSSVPELVFVNCCHLGKTDGAAEAFYRNRFKLAANIGTQLIENGVKVVIAAGWAVDDAAALEFTKVFYDYMFEGYEFGKAVQEARQVIYEKYKYTNTWEPINAMETSFIHYEV